MNTVLQVNLIIVFILLVLYILKSLQTLYISIKNYVKLKKLPGPPSYGIIKGNVPYLGDSPGKSSDY